MTIQIEIDEEVFAFLEQKARPFKDKTPNDVLRYLLLPEKKKSAGGSLKPLLDAGRLKPGDNLVHHQPRKKRVFRAVVTEDGFIEIEDGRRFANPSPALGVYVDHPINGWDHWVVESTGSRLQELRVSR